MAVRGQAGLRLTAAVLAMLSFNGCLKDSSGSGTSSVGPGVATDLQWIDTSNPGGTATGDTPLLWNDPQTGPATRPPNDPSDILTYTYPTLLVPGPTAVRHPLMTHVVTKTHPYIINPEDNLTKALIDWRIAEYDALYGPPPLPAGSTVTEYLQLRQNARANSKHFGVWHAADPFGYTNAHGDMIIQRGGYPYAASRLNPDNSAVFFCYPPPPGICTGVEGRIPKVNMKVDLAGELLLGGTAYMSYFDVLGEWTTNYVPFLMNPAWTHLGVGYWRVPGTTLTHYWTLVVAQNPQTLTPGTGIGIGIGGVGFP